MRKPKENSEEEGSDTQFFDDVEVDGFDDSDDDSIDSATGKPKKPARQRVELRNEQQTLRRQLSDWDDYGQDDFDTKL
jgi:hypothetical protein